MVSNIIYSYMQSHLTTRMLIYISHLLYEFCQMSIFEFILSVSLVYNKYCHICLSMIVETQKADQAIFILCAAYAMRTINVPVIMTFI